MCGHVHDDYGLYGHEHIQAVNFGALSRGTIDEYNVRRQVQVGLIAIEEEENK